MVLASLCIYLLVGHVTVDGARSVVQSASIKPEAFVHRYPSLSATATVVVEVADANDNAPVFDHATYDARVVENRPPGTVVFQPWAADKDIGRNAEIRYSLLPVSGADRFSIDQWSGLITTTVPLDYEDQSAYSLVVIATDCGLISQTGTASIQVAVVDSNDYAPRFTKSSYSVVLYRSLNAGDFVAGIIAVDSDSGLNGQVTYYLNTSSAYFSINSTTGVVFARQAVTTQSFSSLTLTVSASDRGQPSLVSSTTLTISMQSPSSSYVFPQFISRSPFQVPGNTSVGKSIGFVSATTLRVGVTSMTYAVAGGNIDDSFDVDSTTGGLLVKRPLQYWRTAAYDLWIEARDNGSPSLAAYWNFAIVVSSWNQFSPQFVDVWYNASVLEEQLPPVVVVTVSAVDLDLGEAGRVSYSLVANGDSASFQIGESTGIVTTTGKLNRETNDGYQLVVLAYDHGSPGRSASTTVDVAVQGINDNPPVFSELFYAAVYENSPIGTVVLQVTSTDADAGGSTSTRYSLSSSASGLFAIDPVSGVITVAGSIDREVNSMYILKVAANDGAFNIETSITIDVLDENDNIPQCIATSYAFSVLESSSSSSSSSSSASSSFVGSVASTDADATSPNNVTFFRMRNWDRDFVVAGGSRNGSVSWRNGGVRFEWIGGTPAGRPSPTNVRHAVLSVIDRGDPPLSSSCPMTVTVLPENRFSPTFAKSWYQVVIPATAPAGFMIMTLSATDSDTYLANAAIDYSLQNAVDAFAIDTQTGVVALTKSLKGNSSFLVTATDRGVPRRNATVPVFVYVVSSASFAIQFVGDQQAFTATVPEDRPIGYVIGTVRAVYADSSVTGVLVYSVTGGNDGGIFSVDQLSGAISLAARLDYELDRLYAIEITARDSTAAQLFTRRNFTVMVTDVNDNVPLFDRRQYAAYVTEDALIGTTIIALHANDADRGTAYSVIQYYVVGGNASAAFYLDPVSGVVSLRSRLNQTRGVGAYSMTVLAVNPGTNASATAYVTIVVVAINWFPPVFDSNRYSFVLPNSTSVIAAGTVIGHVRASDRDVGVYGQIEYYAVSGSSSSSYIVHRVSGAIVVATALTSPFPVAQFAVLARNPGPVRVGNFDSCSVIIVGPSTGGGEQVPPPSFSQSTYVASVREDVSVGTSVVQVTVNVFDASSTVTAFAIVAGNDGGSFAVDVSGLIRVARKLNRDVSSRYNLSLSATVSSTPPKTATALVIITVLSAAKPYFTPSLPVATVSAPQNSSNVFVIDLKQYTYCDDAIYGRGPFSYQLVNFRDTFVIDSSTGRVQTAAILDRSSVGQYDVNVSVSIPALPASATQLQFVVVVLGSNDACSAVSGGPGTTCLNGGTCLIQTNGNVCRCTSGTRGASCGVAPVTFQSLSYSEQYAVTADSRSVGLSLDVVTNQQGALLFYAVGALGATGGSAFLAVELVSGKPRVSYRQTDSSVVRLSVNRLIDDGTWHHIDVVFSYQGVSMKVSNCVEGSAECVVCPDGDSSCYASSSNQNASPLLLPVWSTVAVGGVSNMSTILNRIGDVSEFNFVGCLRGVSFNGQDLLTGSSSSLSSSSFSSGTSGVCSQRSSGGLCSPNPCLNGGLCVDEWTAYRCQCATGFMGVNCANVSSPVSLGGGTSGVIYNQKEAYRRQMLLTQALTSAAGRRKRQSANPTYSSIALSFLPSSSDGLLFNSTGLNGFTYLYVTKGQMSYTSQLNGGPRRLMVVDGAVSDDAWHNVTITVSGSEVLLTMDAARQTTKYDATVHDPLGLDLLTITVGGSQDTVLIDGTTMTGLSGCINNFLLNGEHLPVDGATDRFIVTQRGRVAYDCPAVVATSTPSVTSSPAWKIPVIVICTIVGFILLIFLPALVVILYVRRDRKRDATKDDIRNNRHKAKNGSAVGGIAGDSTRWSQHNGIQPSNEFRMLSMQPDVVVPELYPSTSINRRCSSDVDMNYDDIRDADGCDNLGYTAPEKFDGIYRHHGGNDPIANGGKLSLAQSLMNGDLHRSPTRLQYVPPASSSPHGFPIENGRTTSPTKRQSPIDKAAAVASAGRPSASGSLRSTPLSAQKEDQAPTHPADENNLASAARGRNLRTTPTVGLTIDEVDRITESRRCTPAVPRTSTTSSDDDDDDGRLSPDIVNRTDFTRDDLELVVAPQPQRHSASLGSTSSDDDDDETNYDTFTNSDYEYAASRRPRSSDFNDPYRLRMPPPSATNAAQPPPPRRRRGGGERLLADPNASAFSSAESTIDDSFSVDGGGWRPASAGTAVGPTSSGRSSVDILRAAELLGWGFKVDQLVDVFIDIAALPDGGSGRTSALAVGGGRSPAGSSVGGAMRDEHPVTHRPQSASSGSRINGEKRSSRRSPAESFDRPTSSPSAAAAAGQQNGARPSSTGSSTYSNQSSAIGGSAAGGGLPGSGRRSANGTATPQLSSSRPVSSASEADNPYLDAQPYIIATGSRPSSSNSGRSTADAFATAAGGSRTTKTPTPTNRNVSASSPLGMIREDDDAVTNNSSTVPSLAYGRQTVLEEYV